jgi:hypothetical protein
MVRSLGAQLGLLAFAAAILAGLHVGNSPTTILIRALLVMLVGYAIGKTVAWTGSVMLREHLQRKKLAIDRAHNEAVRALAEQPATEPTAPAEGG